MLLSDQSWVPFAAALGIGLLIGTERERRKSQGPTRVAAGLRTFTVASLLGAVAQAMGGEILLALAMLTVGAMAAVAYWRGHAEDPGMTTGITLVLTLLLGGLAMQNATLAAALAVAVTALLVGKSWMHGFVRQAVTQGEFNEALALAAASLVVLPLIPDRFLGPLDAFNPRSLWLVVVLMMVVGAAGHVAQRLLGAGAGLSLSGFASGFVSSVATIAAMGERAVRTPGLLGAAVAGAVLSSLATILQLVAVLAATSPET